MAPDTATWLWDAQTAAERALRFVAHKSFDDYLANEMLRAATERQLEIVGEALNQWSKADPDGAKDMANLRAAVGLRNVLIHGYATVDNRLVWDVATAHLPALAAQIKDRLQGLDSQR